MSRRRVLILISGATLAVLIAAIVIIGNRPIEGFAAIEGYRTTTNAQEIVLVVRIAVDDKILEAIAEEGPNEISVKVRIERSGEPHIDLGVIKNVTVELKGPLGTRKVVDAHAGKELPLLD